MSTQTSDTTAPDTTSLHVRPIAFTRAADDWRTLLAALGATALASSEEWSVYALPGGGRFALHALEPGGVPHSTIAFESDERAALLADRASAIADAGGELVESSADHGPVLRLTLPDGAVVLVDDATPVTGGTPDAARGASDRAALAVAVAPLHLTPRPRDVAPAFEALRLRRRLTSDSGVWADVVGDGVLGVHGTEDGSRPSAVLGFEAPDVEAVAAAVTAAGLRCDLADEAYGRTLLVEHPDHPEGDDTNLPGRRLWINETQRDAYGYTDHRR